MNILTVIFDMGGVLVRTSDRRPRVALAERLGMSYDQLSAHFFESQSARLATVGKLTTQQHWEAVREALGLPADEFPAVRLDFWGGDELDTELVDYIRSLRPRYKTMLLSNAWDNLRKVLVQDWQIADAFDEMVISAEVGLAKPDPRIYRLALAQMGVQANQAVFVDDIAENVDAAAAVGLHAIQFHTTEQALAELQRLLDHDEPAETGAGRLRIT